LKKAAKPASQKRASLPLVSGYSKAFIRDWERLSQSGRYDMNKLKVALALIVSNEPPLPAEYLDHALKGPWAGFRECHIGGDFLLIYELKTASEVCFVRAGTHSELFE
jgi:mRNA interferase YafQ